MRAEAIDDLSIAHQPELLPRQTFEDAIRAAEAEDSLAQLVVFAKQTKRFVSERRALAV